MIMEDLVDSGNDVEIGDTGSIYSCSTSLSSFRDSESESNDKIAVDQLPRKQGKARGGLAFRPTQNPVATASVTFSIDPQRDDSIGTLGHPVMNLPNTPLTVPMQIQLQV